ncbi:Helix-turn-helix domain-containing protein [Spirosomataceae bacterium TFI 002]|nr:Helix-turn-helix domain-containing protein [Spirosomataceae bacterium TFI 002]
MEKVESIEDFYKRKFEWMPESIRKDIGHFNVFPVKPYAGKAVPYKRRDYYKIMVIKGNSYVHYADQVIEIKKQAITFSNPNIPYKWEHLDQLKDGFFCVFNKDFFHQFGVLAQYEVFQPKGTHVFELTDEQVNEVISIFEKMTKEINSEYQHKYDVLRTQVFELIHFATKLQPNTIFSNKEVNAAERISSIFLELLERQYPIDENHPSISLRSPSDFAEQLNVHVNHLNKAVKSTTHKSTSVLIAERLLQESKIMLKHSKANISEIAYALGFKEATHFNNFFKKHLGISPSKFRNG